MTITRRTDIGRPLTWAELDNNFAQVDSLVQQATDSVATSTAQAEAASSFATQSGESASAAAATASQIQQSLNQINQNTSDIATVNNNLKNKAASGANGDITAITGLTTPLALSQGGVGSNTAEGARANIAAAAAGVNSDITKLNGLVAGGGVSLGEVILSTGAGEKGVNLSSDSTVGISFGTEATNGGASVFHNFCKGPSGAGIKDGALIGGYGSRPWDGSQYTGHSNSCIHFLQDGDTTITNHGGWLRLLVTPKGSTINSRYSPFALSNNGDTMIGKDLPYGAYKGSLISANFSQYDGRGLKQFINNVNEIHLVSGITSGSSSSSNFRTSLCGGSPLNPGPTQVDSSAYLSLSGFDGTNWTQAQAAVQLRAIESWTSTSSGAELIFSTTKTGDRTRTNRWVVQNDGHFVPAFDNTNSFGVSNKRPTVLYAVNGTVQTSDARLKTEVRIMSANEIEAAKLLSKEIGVWQWLAEVDSRGSEKAPLHIGMTVQRAIEILTQCNLDWKNYSFIIYEEWEEESNVVSYGEDGLTPEIKITPAGDRYSFAPDQLNLFIARGIEARLEALEGK